MMDFRFGAILNPGVAGEGGEMTKKRAVIWILVAGLLVAAAVMAGSIRFTSHLRDVALQQERAEQKENLRFIKAGVEGLILRMEQELAECRRGSILFRPGMTLADGGGE